jgi:hypothetical protein
MRSQAAEAWNACEWGAGMPPPIDTHPPLPYTGALDPYVAQWTLSAVST